MTPPQVAAHLWSVHDLAASDLDAALGLIARAGFDHVETMWLGGVEGFGDLSLTRVADLVDAHGLRVCAAHVPFGVEPGVMAAYRDVLGVTTLAWSLEPDEFTAADRLARGIERVNAAAERAAGEGLHWAYHNHFAEFVPLPEGGMGYSVLDEGLDPRVTFELDAYWPRVVGADLDAALADLTRPIELVHLKDGPATGMDDVMTPVTEHTPGLSAALGARPRWAVVELDRVSGSMELALADSRRALLALAQTEGRP